MKNPAFAVAVVAAATIGLAACGEQNPAYVSQPHQAVTQLCVQPQPDGSALVVDDDLCEDHPSGYAFYYGGAIHLVAGRPYIKGGSRVRPAYVTLKVRPVGKGGSSRTVGRVNSSNEHVSKSTEAATLATPTGAARTARTGEENRRAVNSGGGRSATTPARPPAPIRPPAVRR